MKRTHLPLNALRVFDAAARHLSFTRAADELAVTPAAVGQQIRALEDMLGVVLFRRTPKGLELTGEANAGLEALRQGFLQFEESVRAMQAGQSSQSLTIAAPRDLTAKWLAPRLARYSQEAPDVRFTLVSADGGIDFTEANLDLAIFWTDSAGEHEGVALADALMVTVAGPGSEAIRALHGRDAPLRMTNPPCVSAMPGWRSTPPQMGSGRPMFLRCWLRRISPRAGCASCASHLQSSMDIGWLPRRRSGDRRRSRRSSPR
jgi:Transcriptional regulator